MRGDWYAEQSRVRLLSQYSNAQMTWALGALTTSVMLFYWDQILDEYIGDEYSLFVQVLSLLVFLYVLSGLFFKPQTLNSKAENMNIAGQQGGGPAGSTSSARDGAGASGPSVGAAGNDRDRDRERDRERDRAAQSSGSRHLNAPYYHRHTLDDNFRATADISKLRKDSPYGASGGNNTSSSSSSSSSGRDAGSSSSSSTGYFREGQFKYKANYMASPASVTRSSHVSHGLMLRTSKALAELEDQAPIRLSDGGYAGGGGGGGGTPPLDLWVDRLRVLLCKHISDTLGKIEKLTPKLVNWVSFIYGTPEFLTAQRAKGQEPWPLPLPPAFRKGVERLLRCESHQESILDNKSGGELTLQQLLDRMLTHDWREISDKYLRTRPGGQQELSELQKSLVDFQRHVSIFLPLPTAAVAGRRAKARAGGGGGGGSGAGGLSPVHHSLPLASRLWELHRSRQPGTGSSSRLPLDNVSSSRGRSGARGGGYGADAGAGVVDLAEIAMGAFAHMWDDFARRTGGSSSATNYFVEHCYAAGTDDLDHLSVGGGGAVSIVLDSNDSTSTNYDVFTADDRGPTIMEVEGGRYNVYHSIIFFLLFIYRCTAATADTTSKVVAEAVLRDMTYLLNDAGGGGGDGGSLRTYLSQYLAGV